MLHQACPVRTVVQLNQICLGPVLRRIFTHLNINDKERDFKGMMGNLENKIRRLSLYKLRYNSQFDKKRMKSSGLPFKGRDRDEKLEKFKNDCENIEQLSQQLKPIEFSELLNVEKRAFRDAIIKLLDQFDQEDGINTRAVWVALMGFIRPEAHTSLPLFNIL